MSAEEKRSEENKLKYENGICKGTFSDDDFDTFKFKVKHECIEIDVEDVTYISLNRENLKELLKFMDEADNIYQQQIKQNVK